MWERFTWMTKQFFGKKRSSSFLTLQTCVRPAMEFYWRVCLVFDCPVLKHANEWAMEGLQVLLLFSVHSFVASCLFVSRKCLLIKPRCIKTGEKLLTDGRSLYWLLLAVAWQTGHTHTHTQSKAFYILIQGIRCIGHGVINATKRGQ